MNKNKFFTAVITIIIAVVVLIIIINIIFKDNLKVNQGSYRVSDSVLTSVVELEEKAENQKKWNFDISQNNKVSFLLTSNENASLKEVYLDKFKVNSSNNVNIYLEQVNHDISYEYKDIKNKKVNIYAEKTEDGNYLIEFDIVNKNVISDFTVPSDVKEIKHDGTILPIAKIPVSSIAFNVRYNLVLVENQGQVNTCDVKLSMPNEKIATEGVSVERLNVSDFNFRVDY